MWSKKAASHFSKTMGHGMRSRSRALDKRGYPDEALEKHLGNEKTDGLIKCLEGAVARERTAAARILGRRKDPSSIVPLCDALAVEKALYSRIAISEALGEIGIAALPFLVDLLGKIGQNQHQRLPGKNFNKIHYPLPRDIVARTIIKIGQPALPALEKVLQEGEKRRISEAIDAIGYIAFYTQDHTSLRSLLHCLERYRNDELIVWKIIRAFESYPMPEVMICLEKIRSGSKNQALVREAERSLRQLHNPKKRNRRKETRTK